MNNKSTFVSNRSTIASNMNAIVSGKSIITYKNCTCHQKRDISDRIVTLEIGETRFE
jgi:hypothetical protein